MAEQPIQPPQNPPEEENEHAEVYSVSQDKDGSLHFSRRDFLYFALAVGGTLLVKGVCPRFGASPASSTTQPVQAGMNPLPSVYLHAKPSIDSNIVDTLRPNDIVLLIGDHADLGWVEVATRAGQPGWLMRRFVDFNRAFTSASRDFALSGAQTPTLAQTAAYYIYLPIVIMNGPTFTPTNTPTETPTPSDTPTETSTPTNTPTKTPCASYTCSCNTNPCSCNVYPTGPTATFCMCHIGPCSCNAYPTGPTATFCMCHFGPCSCNSYPNPCTCNAFPCTCNAFPCTCNLNPCSCNSYPNPCTCNAFPCTCNFNPCTCNIAPCSCNFYHPPCTCNFNPCYVT